MFNTPIAVDDVTPEAFMFIAYKYKRDIFTALYIFMAEVDRWYAEQSWVKFSELTLKDKSPGSSGG